MPGTRGATRGAHGAGLALVEALEAVPHAEVVARGRQVWRMPHTMLRECGRSGSKMRTTWGQEQEAAALLEVLHMFPGTPSRPLPLHRERSVHVDACVADVAAVVAVSCTAWGFRFRWTSTRVQTHVGMCGYTGGCCRSWDGS